MTTSRPALRVALVGVLLAAACTNSGSGGTPADPQLHYGRSPEIGANIHYQPDVVIVDGGAGAVKSVTADGLTWLISGTTRNVSQLQPGKIMYVTAFGVGRVLARTSVGPDEAITLGPVTITDVVRDGEFSSHAPVDLGAALAYSTPNRPGLASKLASGPADQPTAGGSSAGPSSPGPISAEPSSAGPSAPPPAPSGGHSFVDPAAVARANPTLPPGFTAPVPPSLPALPPAFGTFPVPTRGNVQANVGSYQVSPFCCAGGIGLHYSYAAKGLKVAATLTLKVGAPSIDFLLRIVGGKIVTATATLQGVAGAHMDVKAATTGGRDANEYNTRISVPIDFTIPINGLLSITVSQVFSLSTVFSARDGVIAAHADYNFGGAVGFGYANGTFGLQKPSGWSIANSLLDSIDGTSLGVTGMVLGYSAKVNIGIGFAGFTAGAWFALAISYAFTRGASEGIIVCRGSSLNVVLSYGLGYRIPAPVAALISLFLRLFRAPPIQSSGGPWGQLALVHNHDYAPKKQLCAPA